MNQGSNVQGSTKVQDVYAKKKSSARLQYPCYRRVNKLKINNYTGMHTNKTCNKMKKNTNIRF